MASPTNRSAPQSRSGQTAPNDFSFHMVSPQALMKLEEHDDAIAAITSVCSDCTTTETKTISTTRVPAYDPEVEKIELATSTKSSDVASFSTTKIPSVDRDDLRRVRRIGTGRFCEVHLNFGPSWLLTSQNNDDSSTNSSNANKRKPPSLVAVKSIDSQRIKDDEELHLAAGELANEAKILSLLDHENIIRLKGVCSESFSESFSNGNRGYFLVFEVLRDTLTDRLRNWRHQKDKKEGAYRKAQKIGRKQLFMPKSMSNNNADIAAMGEARPAPDERMQRMHHRIQETVVGIAKGLEYLHSKKITIRDLKPANIGYEDTNGVKYGSTGRDDTYNGGDTSNSVRLFDFGMAQKVEMCDPLESCGSLRYMAPEVMTSADYTLKVDVYSFGVVLFEVCSLCYPYAKTLKKTMGQKILHKLKIKRFPQSTDGLVEDFQDKIVAREIVPANDLNKTVWCPDFRNLIEVCCSFDPEDRPSFSEIRSRLDSIYHIHTNGNDNDAGVLLQFD